MREGEGREGKVRGSMGRLEKVRENPAAAGPNAGRGPAVHGKQKVREGKGKVRERR